MSRSNSVWVGGTHDAEEHVEDKGGDLEGGHVGLEGSEEQIALHLQRTPAVHDESLDPPTILIRPLPCSGGACIACVRVLCAVEAKGTLRKMKKKNLAERPQKKENRMRSVSQNDAPSSSTSSTPEIGAPNALAMPGTQSSPVSF